MSALNHLTAVRLDDATKVILKDLASDLNFTKSMTIRQSLRLLKELSEIRKTNGEIKLVTGKGKEAKEIILLLS